MGSVSDFTKMHGCACGRPGTKVARRTITLATREWEVDIEHEGGTIHTNRIKLHERPKWVNRG